MKGKKYAVYAGSRVALTRQVQIHGPSVVMDNTFVRMKFFVFKSIVGRDCVIEPAAVLRGAKIAE